MSLYCVAAAELRHRFHEHGGAAHEGLRGPDSARDQRGLGHPAGEAADLPPQSGRVQRQAHLRGLLREEGLLLWQAA